MEIEAEMFEILKQLEGEPFRAVFQQSSRMFVTLYNLYNDARPHKWSARPSKLDFLVNNASHYLFFFRTCNSSLLLVKNGKAKS